MREMNGKRSLSPSCAPPSEISGTKEDLVAISHSPNLLGGRTEVLAVANSADDDLVDPLGLRPINNMRLEAGSMWDIRAKDIEASNDNVSGRSGSKNPVGAIHFRTRFRERPNGGKGDHRQAVKTSNFRAKQSMFKSVQSHVASEVGGVAVILGRHL